MLKDYNIKFKFDSVEDIVANREIVAIMIQGMDHIHFKSEGARERAKDIVVGYLVDGLSLRELAKEHDISYTSVNNILCKSVRGMLKYLNIQFHDCGLNLV